MLTITSAQTLTTESGSKIRGILFGLLKTLGWIILLYIISVACIHLSAFPAQVWLFKSEIDLNSAPTISISIFNSMYLYLCLSGLIIFLCRKKRIEECRKVVKLKKLPLFLAIFFATPFSHLFWEFSYGFIGKINPFRYIYFAIFETDLVMSAIRNETTSLSQLYISRIPDYWSEFHMQGYMITIFCTYYVIREIYLYIHHTSKYF